MINCMVYFETLIFTNIHQKLNRLQCSTPSQEGSKYLGQKMGIKKFSHKIVKSRSM
jgi:hypothetical protein